MMMTMTMAISMRMSNRMSTSSSTRMGMLICRQQGPGADDGLITTIAVVDPGGAAHASGNFAAGDVLYNVASDA